MKTIPSDPPSPFPAVECSGDVGCDAWMPERPDAEWAIAELAAWAALSSACGGNRGSNAASSKEV
jgi:hypothetical protein